MKLNKLLILLVLTIVASSCSNFTKALKSENTESIYNEAIYQYEKGNYQRALQLFDKISLLLKGTDKEENMSFVYADCYFKDKDYVLANYYFKKFAKQFTSSSKAETAAFYAAICKYYQSSTYSLDPTPTTDALSELQSYINNYPLSNNIDLCNTYIDELRAKLEEKDYKIAMMYLRMEEYKAAFVCFENILKDYPDTKRKEDVLFYIVKSKYEFAVNSVNDKKKERFDDVYNAYTKFISYYPNSKYKSEVEAYNKAAKQIN